MGMYIWYGFLITIGIVQAVYFVFRIKRFYFVQKLSRGNKKAQYAIAAVPVLVLFVLALFKMVPVVIVTMYLMIIWMICDLVGVIIRKFTKKSCKVYIAGIVAIVITASFFGYSYYNAHNTQKTELTVKTDKKLDGQPLKVALLSDSHVGTMFDGKGFKKICQDIMKSKPDVVLVCGDYVDDDTSRQDMIDATKALGDMKPKYGTYMVFGNHDGAYFNYRDFSMKDLKEELTKNHVEYMRDDVKDICPGVMLVGRKDKFDKPRKTPTELTKNINKNKDYVIMMDHQPNDFDAEAKAKPDLVLCGHTHGGQLIPLGWTTEIFHTNDCRYGKVKRGDTTFFTSSGIAGWGLPFKSGAKTEYVIINIDNK